MRDRRDCRRETGETGDRRDWRDWREETGETEDGRLWLRLDHNNPKQSVKNQQIF